MDRRVTSVIAGPLEETPVAPERIIGGAKMNYKKCWVTLNAESGGRWCQPHPCSTELLTIGELMRNMERRASEEEETAPSASSNTASMQCPFAIVERFADNGEHSHWELIDENKGTVEWSQHA